MSHRRPDTIPVDLSSPACLRQLTRGADCTDPQSPRTDPNTDRRRKTPPTCIMDTLSQPLPPLPPPQQQKQRIQPRILVAPRRSDTQPAPRRPFHSLQPYRRRTRNVATVGRAPYLATAVRRHTPTVRPYAGGLRLRPRGVRAPADPVTSERPAGCPSGDLRDQSA